MPGVVLKEKYLHPNVKDIKSHTKKRRDCVKIYLDTLLWQIKARQKRVLCNRGLNNFHSMKKWDGVECEGKVSISGQSLGERMSL